MPDYDITSPDGKKYVVTAPQGATQEQILSYAQQHHAENAAPAAPVQKPDISIGRTALDKGLQGATYGFSDEMTDLLGAAVAHMYTGEPFHDMHKEAREESKARLQSESEQHPYVSTASELGGALGTGFAGAGTKAGKFVANNIRNAGTAEKIGKSAILGAGTGALYGAGTSDSGKRLEGAKKGAETGALTGGATATGGEALARAASPVFDKSVKLLRDAGVKLTPGQLSKGTVETLKRMEDTFGSIPFVGNTVRSAVKNSFHSFNTAILNKALAPIGEKMPKNMEAGRQAIAHAEKIIGSKYDKLVPKLKFQLDNQFIADLGQFERDTLSKMSPEMQKTFQSKFKSITEHRLDKNLGMSGEEFKKVESELGYEARNYLSNHNASPQEKELGNALQEAQGFLRDNLERMNPQYAKELKKINESWAMFKRAQGASIRRLTSGGVFSPTDLAADIKKSTSKGSFARGDGLLQDLADAGMEVLPSKVPDSGTVERAVSTGLVLGGGEAARHAGLLNPKAIIPAAGIMGAYSKPGIAGINKWANTTPTRDMIRQAVEKATPAVTGGVSGISGGQQ